MDLNTFIVAVFCLIDDRLKGRRIRSRGPAPKLCDSEVLTIEIVGEFLGIDTDRGIYRFFRRHYREWFPALGEVHRTTFARQAANLWKAKEDLWQELLALTPNDRSFAICDSLPLAACLFARAYRCKRFKGEAAFGKDTLLRQTFYGFRVHVRVCWPGVITRLSIAPANTHELHLLPELVEGTSGIVIGDRNYHSPPVRERPVASGKQTAAQSPLPHRCLPAQPPSGQSTPTALQATHLKNPHIGLARDSKGGEVREYVPWGPWWQ